MACLGLALSVLALVAPAAAGEMLALVGGTVIDVDDWGRSEEDLEDAVVLVEDGTISAVGRRNEIEIPSGAEIWMSPAATSCPG